MKHHNNTVLLYRESLLDPEELAVAEKYFDCTPYRTEVPRDSLVIGRYSVLPFYKEQADDMANIDSELINSPRQHDFIADLSQWAMEDGPLHGLTPRSWMRLIDVPDGGPYVLKGKTNSKKFQWDTHMYAADKKAAAEVYYRLLDDTLIGQQDIFIREYVPFKKLMTGLKGMPVTMEFRFFVAFGEILSGAFYWSSHVEDLEITPDPSMVPRDFLNKVIDNIKEFANFVVIDVGQLEDGSWMVVELNDGQMSGLSENDPHVMYRRLSEVVESKRRSLL